MRLTVPALAILLLVPLASVAAAQAGHHGAADGPRVLLLRDAPDDGRAVVGALAHFGFALVDPTGAPIVHQDARFTLTQNGRVLFTTDDAHEYDGLFAMDWTFAEAGPYEARAELLDGETVVAEDAFTGVAVRSENVVEARVNLAIPGSVTTGAPAAFAVAVEDAATGALLAHSDALVEARRVLDGMLVLRAHLHTHEEPMAFTFLFPTPGAYEVRVLGYNAFPDGEVPDYATAVAVATVDVAPGLPVAAAPRALPAPAPLAALAPGAPRADAPRADPGHGTNGTEPVLFVTSDPTPIAGQAIVGPFTQVRLSGFAYAPDTGHFLPHVNFVARLDGPAGVVFASESLHEYDGQYELLVAGLAPGEHRFVVEAQKGGWTASGEHAFRVLPPVLPTSVGPYTLEMADVGEPLAGEPVDLTFIARNALGMPLAHVETDVTVLAAADAAPLATFKVHTHDEGDMTGAVAFPHAGEWLVVAHPTTLEPRASVTLGPDGPGLIVFRVTVLPAAVEEVADALDATTPEGLGIPSPALAALAALGLAALARRTTTRP